MTQSVARGGGEEADAAGLVKVMDAERRQDVEEKEEIVVLTGFTDHPKQFTAVMLATAVQDDEEEETTTAAAATTTPETPITEWPSTDADHVQW